MIEVLKDPLHRIAYSTDASAYREIPSGVAYPLNSEDVVNLVNFVGRNRSEHSCIIPRAGGTSIAGQVVGSGVVADISKHLNKILEINDKERWARVEPGVVLDELNIALKPFKLFFSPETSTSNRCCIGGMFGNNSCGTHSLVYGSTRDHILESKGVLADGTLEHFKDYTIEELEGRFGERFWENNSDKKQLIDKIYSQLINFALNESVIKIIEESYPHKKLKRRSCGYAIDEVIEDLHNESKPLKERKINLCKLLAGSEGTLAFITEIKVSLDPLPPSEVMALCAHCSSLEKSFYANLVALKYADTSASASVTAIELIDNTILELSKNNVEQQKNRFFVKGNPNAILIIEIKGETIESAESLAKEIENDLMNTKESRCDNENLVYDCSRVYGSDIQKIWSLRKAGLGLLGGMKGDAKPIGVIEDTAVYPEYLPDYMRDFRQMLSNLGLSCVYYSHISTGELHLRPILNIKKNSDRELFRKVAEETAKLVKKYKGSLSGEHGDGRLRGEFIPLMYGEQAYALMRDVKKCWDKEGIFNVGKIVDTPPMDTHLRFEVNQQYAIEKELDSPNTYFNWKGDFDDCKIVGATGASCQIHALMCSIEQCNGAGDCRKSNLIGGTLCPAYKVSKDETKTTRARANILREILTRGWNSEVFKGDAEKGSIFSNKELKDVLYSCLACKGCKSECPSNVDMTKLRAEILQHIYDKTGTPFRTKMVANLSKFENLGGYISHLYNFFASWKPSANIIKNLIGFSKERAIPRIAPKSLKSLINKEIKELSKDTEWQNNSKVVYLFADEFTNHQEPELGLKFFKLLTSLGYKVIIPTHFESGRAAISKGCLRLAKRIAIKNFNLLKDIVTENTPLVGIEPSCILSFRDEYPNLVDAADREEAKELAKSCLLFDEFLLRELENGNISRSQFKDKELEIWLHGHCHQKALIGIEKTTAVLEKLTNAKVNKIPSGCCGMAGSFGYEKEHYKTSLEIGEMVLFPAVREAVKRHNQNRSLSGKEDICPMFIVAPGTSCRHQIFDGTGYRAVHPIEILYEWNKKDGKRECI